MLTVILPFKTSTTILRVLVLLQLLDRCETPTVADGKGETTPSTQRICSSTRPPIPTRFNSTPLFCCTTPLLRSCFFYCQSKEQYGRELAWLNPRVVLAENRGAEIEGLVDQMNLRLSLLGTSQKKAAEEIRDLKVTPRASEQYQVS